MITFLLCFAALIAGYFLYGAFIERMVEPNKNKVTVAVEKADGVDFTPLPPWKIFMIQFLNIAGMGPIFGAIMGAKFGVESYLWIVLGTIFAGAVHDYVAGMISLRNGGESLPESIGRYLGAKAQYVMRIFTVVLLILVGVVFVSAPAAILGSISAPKIEWMDATFWIIIVFIYYIVATLLPIDKIIGRIYPLFAMALIFMALGIFVQLFFKGWELPELFELSANHPQGMPIFPIMFISIACGAISGFHASQSPLMARCMTNETQGKPIFYGSMIVEGMVALIWAAAATYFFHANGFEESNAGIIVNAITVDWLGSVGALLAMLGVVFAPITSGDTALRSARLIIADALGLEQKSIAKRLLITIPIFIVVIGILLYSIGDKDGFNIIWRYFALSNQTLAVFTLWMITVYFVREGKRYIVALIPALFMTAVVTSYLLIAKECFALAPAWGYSAAGVAVLVSLACFIIWRKNYLKSV